MLDPSQARVRQTRLLQILQERKLDAAVIGLSQHAYYFTAHLPFWLHQAGFVLFADGRSVLISANEPITGAAADEVVPYEASWMGTQRQEQPAVVADRMLELLKSRRASRIGIDASAVSSQLATTFGGDTFPLDPDLWQLRRRKDPDELALMRRAIDCTKQMYERARAIIEPGIPELRVFSELYAAAVDAAGEPLSALLGNDYACGVPGGPVRGGRTARPGELYILDLGPAYRGYFADNCRVFAVDRKLTDAQFRAWEVVTGALRIVESLARPGVRCQELFKAVDAYYRTALNKPFPHHLGHGVGLQPHEFPHLNPKWDDVLMEGEIFTAEPGLYGPELAGGIRIENQYRVGAQGVENLTPLPMEMV